MVMPRDGEGDCILIKILEVILLWVYYAGWMGKPIIQQMHNGLDAYRAH